MLSKFESYYAKYIDFSCELFDRIILKGYIPLVQRENGMVYFLRNVRGIQCISKEALKELTKGFIHRVEKYSQEQQVLLLTAERNDSKLSIAASYDTGNEGVVCILKSKEYGRSFSSYEPKKAKDKNYRRICRALHEVNHYYFYIRDEEVGGLNYIKICSCFPFNVEIYVNGHNWLEVQLQREGIGHVKEDNCILEADDVPALQRICSRLNDDPLWRFADRWIYKFVPILGREREAGYYYRYFISQVEYSNNIVFKDERILDELFQAMIDQYRRIGKPDSISQIFERRITSRYRGVFQSNIHMERKHPCIKSWYKKCYVKQYNKKGRILRTEPCINNTRDLGIGESIVNLGYVGKVCHGIAGRYLDSQVGIDDRFLARHNLADLSKTEQVGNKRITGIRIEDERIMGVIAALLKRSNVISHITNKDLRKEVQRVRKIGEEEYGSTKMGYDLKRLLMKKIIKRVKGTHKYIFTKIGYKICLMLLLIKDRVVEPIISGIRVGVKTAGNYLKLKLNEQFIKVNNVLDEIFESVCLKKSEILVQNTRSP
ncbi:hypothetical protein ES705_08620 [subsurface metagenome]